MEILAGKKLIKRDLSSKTFEEVIDDCDIFAIYFSAHWCPPCREFTPILADVYKQLQESGKKFEVIFVSSDNSSDEMIEYMVGAHGDWYSLEFNDSAKDQLKAKYKVGGIPTLVALKKDGSLASADASEDVEEKGVAVWDTWTA